MNSNIELRYVSSNPLLGLHSVKNCFIKNFLLIKRFQHITGIYICSPSLTPHDSVTPKFLSHCTNRHIFIIDVDHLIGCGFEPSIVEKQMNNQSWTNYKSTPNKQQKIRTGETPNKQQTIQKGEINHTTRTCHMQDVPPSYPKPTSQTERHVRCGCVCDFL